MVPQVLDCVFEKFALLKSQGYTRVAQQREDIIHLSRVFLQCLGKYDDVIQVYEAKLPLYS